MFVIPAAVVGAILVAFPVHWIVLCTFKWGDVIQLTDKNIQNVEHVGFAFAAPLAFVLCGARIAPNRKLGVAIILGILTILLAVASFLYVVSDPSLRISTPVRGSIGAVFGLVGIATAIVVVKSWCKRT